MQNQTCGGMIGRYVGLFACLLVSIALACVSSTAQSTYATISGTITDPSGAVVVGADVVVTAEDTGVAVQTKSNSAGVYSVPNLKPGPYRVTVAKDGFRQMVVRDITLNVQDVINTNFSLQVGAFSEIVQVEGHGMNINTTDASVSTVIDQSYVANMPLNGRSFQDLILLTPGVVTQTPQSFFANQGGLPGGQGEFSVNGQRLDENYYTVDGVSAMIGAEPGNINLAGPSGSVAASTIQGTTQALVSVDALQEFRVQSSTYSAEYGRGPGGQFAFETKSGVNQWHGSGFDYLRNGFFDANDWFNNFLGVRGAALRQNDFGGILGGPVRIPHLYNGKDKTFFFFSYEGLRLAQPVPATQGISVPDLCVRGNNADCTAGETPAAAPIQSTLNAFPLPTTPTVDGSGIAPYLATWSNPSSINSTSIRLDHVVNDKHRLFFRFSNTGSSSAARGGGSFAASVNGINSGTVRTYTAGATSVFTNRWSNDLRLNYSSNETIANDTIAPIGGSSPVNMQTLTNAGSGSTIFFALCCGAGGNFLTLFQGPTTAAQYQWNLVDTVGFAVGRHQFKFGGDFRRLTPNVNQSSPSETYLFFAPNSPFGGLDTNTPLSQVTVENKFYPLYKNLSLYATDEWKATSRLTVSMGLRWELNPPPGVTQGLMPYTAQGTNVNNYQAAPQGTPLWKTTYTNFAPRLGFAYSLRSKGGWETVLRTGSGVFYDSGNQLGSQGFVGAGFFAANTYFFTNPYPIDVTAPGVLPTITNPPGSDGNKYRLFAFYPHLQLPYTIDWNTAIEQSLGKSQTFTVTYVGSHGARLIQLDGFHVPNTNPDVNSYNLIHNETTSDYNSLQTQFQRRMSKGLTALASYTWSHCFDYSSYNNQEVRQRGNCSFDIRNNFSAAFSYNLPSVGHSIVADALLNHWGLDDRFMVHGGFPLNVFTYGTTPQPDGQLLDQVIVSTGQPSYLYGSNCNQVMQQLDEFQPKQPQVCPGGVALNPCAFVVQGQQPTQSCVNLGMGGTPGAVVPRNWLRGLGAWQMDLAIRREFPIYENLKLQFRAEAFNVFNHPNFGAYDNTVGDSTFGLIQNTLGTAVGQGGLIPLYQMGGNRSMQFALKLIF